MLVSEDEVADYNSFAVSMLKKLGCNLIDPESTLWHYTTGVGLLGILRSQSIYSTQVACLNDSEEIRYASALFRQGLLTRKCIEPSTTQFVKDAMNYFDEKPASPNHVRVANYVTCFSEVPDDLSQWRAYGGGENGYAIGFKAKHLRQIPNCFLGRITYYDERAHAYLVQEVVDATITFYQAGLGRHSSIKPDIWTEAFLSQWDLTITQIAPMVKNPAFASEKECRLSKLYIEESELKQLEFIQRANMLSRHLPLKPAYDIRSPAYSLPISEVIVGPCRYPHVSLASTQQLIQKYGFDPSLARRSLVPFQAT